MASHTSGKPDLRHRRSRRSPGGRRVLVTRRVLQPAAERKDNASHSACAWSRSAPTPGCLPGRARLRSHWRRDVPEGVREAFVVGSPSLCAGAMTILPKSAPDGARLSKRRGEDDDEITPQESRIVSKLGRSKYPVESSHWRRLDARGGSRPPLRAHPWSQRALPGTPLRLWIEQRGRIALAICFDANCVRLPIAKEHAGSGGAGGGQVWLGSGYHRAPTWTWRATGPRSRFV